MTYIAYVPAFKRLHTEADPRPYQVISDIAQARRIPHFKLGFQSAAIGDDSFSSLGEHIACQIETLETTYRAPGFIVAAESGAGILIQSFTSMETEIGNLPHVLAIKPIFNPLKCIADEFNRMRPGQGTMFSDMLLNDEVTYIDLPHDIDAQRQNGFIRVRKEHLLDEDALRLLEDDRAFSRLADALDGRQMASLTIVAGACGQEILREDSTPFIEAFRPYARNGGSVVKLAATPEAQLEQMRTLLTQRLDRVLS